MALRVIQWATGGVGRAAIEGIVAHPDLELAGVWVHSADKEGRDAGELAGIDPVGVAATTDVDALLATDADCVLYAPIMADDAVVARILASGKNVVTPLNWFYPGRRDVTALEAACSEGGATLHGTGIHPGGITERFPLMVSALSQRITHVRAEEFSDIRTYGAPDVIRDIMLFGKTPEEAATSPDGAVHGRRLPAVHRHGGRHPRASASTPRIRTSHEVAVATAPDRLAHRRDRARAWSRPSASRGRRPSTASPSSPCAPTGSWARSDLDPAWTFGPKGERFEVEVTGDPSSLVTFHGWHPVSIEAGLARNPGIVATATHCVSAIPYVCAAPPGIRTYLDLPLIAGRAAPELRYDPR